MEDMEEYNCIRLRCCSKAEGLGILFAPRQQSADFVSPTINAELNAHLQRATAPR
jgi:hypothetical protein